MKQTDWGRSVLHELPFGLGTSGDGSTGLGGRIWLLGQFFDMLIVGTLCGVGLALLSMPLAFVLAVIAGLLNFVPYIGAITAAVPALVVALSLGGREALFVALLYLGVQLFEGNVTAPLI